MRFATLLLAAAAPAVTLAAGNELATGPSDLNPQPLRSLEQAIARGDYPNTSSVLIVRNAELAYEHYFGEGSVEVLNNTRSATKFMTTLALGAAISDGAIPSEHAPAFRFLEDLKP